MPGSDAALMIAPEAPYPMHGGGALRTASLLHHLARHYDLDLIVFREPGAPDPRKPIPSGLLRSLSVLDLPSNSRGLTARTLRNGSRLIRGVPPLIDRFSGFERNVAAQIADRKYAVGVIEHSWAAPYLDQIALQCRRTVLNLHNIESVLHDRSASAAYAPVAFAHRVFRDASRRRERGWFRRFGTVLAASEVDADHILRLTPEARVTVYPNALPSTPLPPRGNDDAIVFSGNMEYHPNVAAVRYFRREIWPVVRERFPSLTWRLVGKNPDAVRRYTFDDQRIELTGPVHDAVAEIARARAAVVPLLSGSGTRLKILEAWAAGVPVISTTIGAEGLKAISGETVLIADTARQFAGELTRLLTCSDLQQKLGDAGRSLFEKDFTWEKAWARLDF